MSDHVVLLVEDEMSLMDLMRSYYIKEGYKVLEARDGFSALDFFEKEKVDLIVLDIMLEQSDGWTVCREIRKTSQVPILMLTARNQESDKLFGFELGADDYMTKPFSLKELMARSRALVKRAGFNHDGDMMVMGRLQIDRQAHKVFMDDQEIVLTPKEHDLLLHFVSHAGIALSREQLLAHVWGYAYFGELRTVDTHVKRLRHKLGHPGYIVTVFGIGYRFEVI